MTKKYVINMHEQKVTKHKVNYSRCFLTKKTSNMWDIKLCPFALLEQQLHV